MELHSNSYLMNILNMKSHELGDQRIIAIKQWLIPY